MVQAIYFDMDGTIADLYGVENWLSKLRAEDVSPYQEAEPLCDMKKLNALLAASGLIIGVISWSAMGGSKTYNKEVRAAKLAWINENLPCVTEFHVVKYGTPKHYVRKIKNSVLVDDNFEVRSVWPGQTIDATQNVLAEIEKLLAEL